MVTAEFGVSAGDDWLFQELTLDLLAGQCLALTGPNGTGKSTLLHCLYGLRPPTEGTVTIAGSSPDERSSAFRRAVSVLLDDSTTSLQMLLNDLFSGA